WMTWREERSRIQPCARPCRRANVRHMTPISRTTIVLVGLLFAMSMQSFAQQRFNVFSEADLRDALSHATVNDSIWLQADITLMPALQLPRIPALFQDGFRLRGLVIGEGVIPSGLSSRLLSVAPNAPFGYGNTSASGTLDTLNLTFGTALHATGSLTVTGAVSVGDVCPCGTWVQVIDTGAFRVMFLTG